jgi:hypothetical protein
MTHDRSFWTWPIDLAAERTRSRALVVISSMLYATGAIVLLAQMLLNLPPRWSVAGAGLVLAAVAGSIALCAKVMINRSRLSFR